MTLKFIKETIIYYITQYWYFSYLYNKYIIPILWFDKDLMLYDNKKEALLMIYKKKYKYVSKQYMLNKINEKFK